MLMGAAPAWHLVTCEYPPRLGGVADWTRVIAQGLAKAGREVHVWSPAPAAADDAAIVHALPDGYRLSALGALDRELDSCSPPRRLLVQWVPHGYGYKSLNLPFCLWVRRRARQGDEVQVMVHEPFLPFDATRVRQNAGAAIHRLMLRILLEGARRIWVSTSSFESGVRRFAPSSTPIEWLPVPSSVVPVNDPAAVAELRFSLAGGAPVVGHFGTCGALVEPMLGCVLGQLSATRPDARLVLVGRGTDAFAQRLISERRLPEDALAIAGPRQARDLSLLLQCCDVFVQPYPDGASTRRTTLMSLLEHGCAVVTSSGPRTEHRWSSTDAVTLTHAGDAPAMASRAVALLDQPLERAAMGDRARMLYRSAFDACHAVARLLETDRVPTSVTL